MPVHDTSSKTLFVERQNVERHIIEKRNVENLFGKKAYLVEN